LLAGRTTIVADIGPVLTGAEAYAAVAPGINITLSEQENLTAAMERAERGAELARQAGFDATARAELSTPTWEGIVDLANEVDVSKCRGGSGRSRRQSRDATRLSAST
jgi:hypothetical protein